MRLAIVGKTRSGKSTALHRLLSHALRHPWAGVLLLDGKGSELKFYAHLPGVRYLGPDEIKDWADALATHDKGMTTRYAAMIARGLRSAAPGDPCHLIVIDEVQTGTRHDQIGKTIKKHLTAITEQSAALNDVLMVTTQREINAVPPSARHNISAWLRMLGQGYYHLQPDGQATQSGRTGNLTPAEALAAIGSGEAPLPLLAEHLSAILGSQTIQPTRAPTTLYTGPQGSGKTWHLHNHAPQRPVTRRIYIDLSQPHRQCLIHLIEQAGAAAPMRASIPQLAEIAGLALQSEPTLLLFDNLERATEKTIATIDPLIEAATECALAAKTPEKPAEKKKIAPLIARVTVQEIKPLPRSEALELARQNLPATVADPQATERRILELSKGHPATVVDLATRTQKGTLEEVRHFFSNQVAPINLGWLLVLPLFFLLLLWQADGYVVVACGLLAMIILRRLLMRQLAG